MQRDVRASDAERELIVERLARAMGQGRLSTDEFSERAAAAHAAVTRGSSPTSPGTCRGTSGDAGQRRGMITQRIR